MSKSWLDNLWRRFLKKPPLSGCFDPAVFERLCLENPQAAIEALQCEQRDLAAQFEATCLAYQDRLNDLALKLNDLEPKELRRESKALREAQDSIRKNLRRLEASMMNAAELERELKEWSARQDESGPRHADHPDVRAEILRSELAVRSRKIALRAIAPEESPFAGAKVHSSQFSMPSGDVKAENEAELVEEKDAELPEPDVVHLIEAIRQGTREAERWHEVMSPDAEALEQVKQMKSLHAALKQKDRKDGIRRDRIEMAVRMRR
ncbi:hypothetical protein KKF59_04010 [Patescibacteria group bacterium]|nr:hypothetical protein [Patescibacteria group bacterium]MBU1908259.1 hypothetical protein [Patescibacteria group bacterium]